jgi:hypothetical protein
MLFTDILLNLDQGHAQREALATLAATPET